MIIRRTVSALALVAGIAAAAGCAAAPDGPRPQAVPQPPPAALQSFYDQTLNWEPCSADHPAFDCAHLTVPLDYADPAGRTARIGVARKQATDLAHRIGSLVVNPGGPGGSGVDMVPEIAGTDGGRELNTRFDLVGFDPRGVGYSTPTVRCLTPAERDEQRAGELDAAQVAARCAERNDPVVLANIGTRDVARDLDVLRAALGDQRLTYLGYSYGTSIGTGYAEAFPGNVRALVLDGAIDPSRSPAEVSATDGAAFGRAVDAFVADCTTRSDCPLGTDRSTAQDELGGLIDPLADAPAATTLDGRSLSYPDAYTAVASAMYDDDAWGVLRAGLADLRAGDGTALLEMADSDQGRLPDGSYDNSADLLLAVNCVDSPHPALGTPEADPCAHWPVPNSRTPHEPQVDGLPQVLVVSTTGDPATAYRNGVSLAKQLDARLLTVEGDQHTAVLGASPSPCVDDIAVRYLVDLTLPAKGATCRLDEPVS